MRSRPVVPLLVMLATLLVGVLVPASPALGAPPRETLSAKAGEIQGSVPSAVVMDAAGRTFVVVTTYTGASSSSTRDIYVYRMDGTVLKASTLSADYTTSTSVEHGLTLVAMPCDIKPTTGECRASGFAAAGLDKTLFYFNSHPSQIERAEWSKTLAQPPTALAVDPDATYVVVGETSPPAAITGTITSSVTVFPNPATTDAKKLHLSEPIVDLAYAQGSTDTLSLVTKKTHTLLTIDSTGTPKKASKDFYPLTGDAVRTAVSDDGKYAAVVTEGTRNYLYLFNHTGVTPTTVRSPAAQELSAKPTHLAMDAAGSRGVIALANGKVAYFERNNDDTITLREFNAAALHVRGVSITRDGGLVLVASHDASSSNPAMSTTSNGNVAAYQTPIQGATVTPIWKASTSGYAPSHLSVSRDGKAIGVVGFANNGSRAGMVLSQFADARLTAAAGETTIKALPGNGDPISFDVVVKNAGSLAGDYTFTGRLTDVGAGARQWTAAFNRTSCTLAPDASCPVRVTFQPPVGGVDPGTYNLEMKATGTEGGEATLAFRVGVSEIRNIFIRALNDVTLKNFQRSSDTFTLVVENRGNVDSSVSFDIRQTLSDNGPSWSVSAPTTMVPKNSVREVQLSVTPRAESPSGQINTIRVTPKIGVETLTANTLELKATVDALPRVEVKAVRDAFETRNESIKVPTDDDLLVSLRITNTGNVRDTYNLWANITPSTRANQWTSRLDVTTVELEPGQSKTVSLYLAPTKKTSGAANVVVEVKSDLGTSATRTYRVERLPVATVSEEETPWYSVPGLELSLLAAAVVGTALVAARRRRV